MLSIKKFFTKDISKADETKVEFSVDTKVVGKTWYEEAVRDVLLKRVKEGIKAQMSEMCYSEEEVMDTKGAISKYGDYIISSDDYHNMLVEFPKVQAGSYHHGFCSVGFNFDLTLFINRVVGDFYE